MVARFATVKGYHDAQPSTLNNTSTSGKIRKRYYTVRQFHFLVRNDGLIQYGTQHKPTVQFVCFEHKIDWKRIFAQKYTTN